MAIDDLFEIAPEVSVERHCGTVGFRQRDRFREQTAGMRLGGAQHGHGPRVIFDHDVRACAHVGQERLHVSRGGFRFRGVNHIFSHNLIIRRDSLPLEVERVRCYVRRLQLTLPTMDITGWGGVPPAPRAVGMALLALHSETRTLKAEGCGTPHTPPMKCGSGMLI